MMDLLFVGLEGVFVPRTPGSQGLWVSAHDPKQYGTDRTRDPVGTESCRSLEPVTLTFVIASGEFLLFTVAPCLLWRFHSVF